MTISAPSVPAGGKTQPRNKSKLNRWDSPWLNIKFIAGLLMVGSIMLLGVLGPLFWDITLSYPASSPLNLPPVFVPGYGQTAEQIAAEQLETESASSGSLTGGNPFKKQEEAKPSAGTAGSLVRFGTPTWAHPLGTESNGRDMLAVLMVGAPRSLYIGLIAATIGMFVGIILGFTAGYMGGWVDGVIRTISDSIVVIPSLAVLIVISAYVRTVTIESLALLLALFLWPGPTRLIRAQVLSMRERGYVQMARISGASTFSIMFKEMMPNMLPYLAASYTGNVSGAILAAASLEALGLGPTRIPTLGMTIFYAIRAAAVLRGMWWWWGIPILALIVVFSGLFLMTTGLDEIANPRLRGRKKAAAA